MIIYLITNKINGKQYVGQTTRSFNKRWLEHCCNGITSSKSAISNAIKKYGKDEFTTEIIDNASNINELNEKEQYWISKLNTLSKGYNLTPGGLNCEVTKITREKLSKASTGRKRSESAKEKMLIVHLGSKRSILSKQKMSAVAKNPNRLKHLTKIRIFKKIKDQNNNIYNSISEASRITNTTRTGIHNVLKGEWKQVKGYIFSYLE